MNILVFAFGFIFGAILQYARLNKFNTISGMAIFKDFAIAKAILIALGVGMILINIEIGLGLSSFHTKPFITGGIILGGLIFGSGMAILGYCPGTLPISAGEGSLDAMVGMIGGLLGGFMFTIFLPAISGFLGPDLGNITLKTALPDRSILYFILIFMLALSFIVFSFWIHKKEKAANYKWLISGIALAILNGILNLEAVSDRLIGASTAYPYVIDHITGLKDYSYYLEIQKHGKWELIFLIGAFFSGLILSVIRKEFRFVLIYDNWKEHKGDSSAKRIIWSLVGGFLIVFGARMAGGCTSGHIISGGMQIAASSYVFAVFVFMSLLITGKFFYRRS